MVVTVLRKRALLVVLHLAVQLEMEMLVVLNGLQQLLNPLALKELAEVEEVLVLLAEIPVDQIRVLLHQITLVMVEPEHH